MNDIEILKILFGLVLFILPILLSFAESTEDDFMKEIRASSETEVQESGAKSP